MKKIVSGCLYVGFLLLMVEATLRFQRIGDLEFRKYDLSLLSDTLNHKPNPSEGYDEYGIQIDNSRPSQFPAGVHPFTVLFMGDSFMQGLDPEHSIPAYIKDYFDKAEPGGKPILLLNAGYSSYSPAIYIPQAKKLIPHTKPDLVVVDIDETDLVDDYANYRPLITRDQNGKIIGVKASPVYRAKVLGFTELRKQPVYMVRFIGKGMLKAWIYFANRAYQKKHKAKYYEDPASDRDMRFSYNLAPAFDPSSSEEKYAPEIEFFRTTVDELLETLILLLGGPDKVLILYHPHLNHLTPDFRGVLWKSYVSPVVEEATSRHGIDFYNAADDLSKRFGLAPGRYYLEGNMHFNEEGLKIYAELIANKIEDRLAKEV